MHFPTINGNQFSFVGKITNRERGVDPRGFVPKTHFSRISFLDKVPEQKEETLVTENFMSAPLPFGTFLMLAENRLSTGQDS